MRNACRQGSRWVLLSLFTMVGILSGGPAAQAQETGKPAARCESVHGALLAKADGYWQSIKVGATVPAEAELIALFDATLQSLNGAVELRLPADVGHRGPFPVLESAVTLHNDPSHDMSLTAERGLMILRNLKKDGDVSVQFRLHGNKVELKLLKPGTKVAIEVYGRLAPGMPKFNPKDDDPVVFVHLLVLQGEVEMRNTEKKINLQAPPGPALLQWDSLLRVPEIHRLEKLPDTAQPITDAEKAKLKQLAQLAEPLSKGDVEAIKKNLQSKDPFARQSAVTILGALEHIPTLAGVLAASPHADTRDQAVLVARNWLGRRPGQTVRLAEILMKEKGLTEAQAHSGVQLLLGFEDEKRSDPDLYAMLITYLNHSRPPVRHLAHWHLVRLAPAGRDIPFDSLAPEAERQASAARWRELIPEGKLPPAPAKASK